MFAAILFLALLLEDAVHFFQNIRSYNIFTCLHNTANGLFGQSKVVNPGQSKTGNICSHLDSNNSKASALVDLNGFF